MTLRLYTQRNLRDPIVINIKVTITALALKTLLIKINRDILQYFDAKRDERYNNFEVF